MAATITHPLSLSLDHTPYTHSLTSPPPSIMVWYYGICEKAQDQTVPECSCMCENHKKCLKGYPSNLTGTMCERGLSVLNSAGGDAKCSNVVLNFCNSTLSG